MPLGAMQADEEEFTRSRERRLIALTAVGKDVVIRNLMILCFKLKIYNQKQRRSSWKTFCKKRYIYFFFIGK